MLRIGVLAAVFPFLFGSLVGSAAGYYGRWVDTVVMRTVDVITAVPFFVLVTAVVAFLGPGEVNIFVAIGATQWVVYARLVRGEVLRERNLDYVAAGRALGFARRRILLGHILPNALPPAIIFFTSDVVLVILTTAALGFLGLGVRPPAPEWGMMMSEGGSSSARPGGSRPCRGSRASTRDWPSSCSVTASPTSSASKASEPPAARAPLLGSRTSGSRFRRGAGRCTRSAA